MFDVDPESRPSGWTGPRVGGQSGTARTCQVECDRRPPRVLVPPLGCAGGEVPARDGLACGLADHRHDPSITSAGIP
jgi:hypothetical protein